MSMILIIWFWCNRIDMKQWPINEINWHDSYNSQSTSKSFKSQMIWTPSTNHSYTVKCLVKWCDFTWHDVPAKIKIHYQQQTCESLTNQSEQANKQTSKQAITKLNIERRSQNCVYVILRLCLCANFGMRPKLYMYRTNKVAKAGYSIWSMDLYV